MIVRIPSDNCIECMFICVRVLSFAYALNTGLLEVIVPSPQYYPNFDTLQDTFGDTMERVRQDIFVCFCTNFLQLFHRLHLNFVVVFV